MDIFITELQEYFKYAWFTDDGNKSKQYKHFIQHVKENLNQKDILNF